MMKVLAYVTTSDYGKHDLPLWLNSPVEIIGIKTKGTVIGVLFEQFKYEPSYLVEYWFNGKKFSGYFYKHELKLIEN